MMFCSGAVMMGHSMPMMTGVVGDAPTAEDLSLVYSSYVVDQASTKRKPSPRQQLDRPTVWKRKGRGIYKVELCPLSAKWYWTKVAVCSCKDDKDD